MPARPYAKEGGKLALAEALHASFSYRIRCGSCGSTPRLRGFNRDSAGKADSEGHKRRYWQCQRANSKLRDASRPCGKLSNAAYIQQSRTYISADEFEVTLRASIAACELGGEVEDAASLRIRYGELDGSLARVAGGEPSNPTPTEEPEVVEVPDSQPASDCGLELWGNGDGFDDDGDGLDDDGDGYGGEGGGYGSRSGAAEPRSEAVSRAACRQGLDVPGLDLPVHATPPSPPGGGCSGGVPAAPRRASRALAEAAFGACGGIKVDRAAAGEDPRGVNCRQRSSPLHASQTPTRSQGLRRHPGKLSTTPGLTRHPGKLSTTQGDRHRPAREVSVNDGIKGGVKRSADHLADGSSTAAKYPRHERPRPERSGHEHRGHERQGRRADEAQGGPGRDNEALFVLLDDLREKFGAWNPTRR